MPTDESRACARWKRMSCPKASSCSVVDKSLIEFLCSSGLWTYYSYTEGTRFGPILGLLPNWRRYSQNFVSFQLLSIVASKSRVQPRVCAAHGKRPINAEFHTLADFQKGAAAFRTALMRNRGVERVYVQSALRVRLSSLDLVQKSIVFLNNGALKSALAPTQGITVIPTYCGREMLISVLFDEFNHIFDGHREPPD